jgi:hypothetical protein
LSFHWRWHITVLNITELQKQAIQRLSNLSKDWQSWKWHPGGIILQYLCVRGSTTAVCWIQDLFFFVVVSMWIHLSGGRYSSSLHLFTVKNNASARKFHNQVLVWTQAFLSLGYILREKKCRITWKSLFSIWRNDLFVKVPSPIYNLNIKTWGFPLYILITTCYWLLNCFSETMAS